LSTVVEFLTVKLTLWSLTAVLGVQGKAYMFMMRTKQPAGLVSNQLYLTMDDLADQVRCPERLPLQARACTGPAAASTSAATAV